jgi:hypothetical protein
MDDFATKKFSGISKMALFCPVQIKFDALFFGNFSHSAFKYACFFL